MDEFSMSKIVFETYNYRRDLAAHTLGHECQLHSYPRQMRKTL